MDISTSYNQFSGIGDVPSPRELDVETTSGVKATIAVPHAVDETDFLQLGFAPPTHRMALILHGQGGHRNYCYQKKLAHKLAAELGMYSLRIDFRGCGSSAEVVDSNLGRTLESDIADIQEAAELVLDASKNPLHISFDLSAIIGHSRGALAMFVWAVEQEKHLRDPKTAESAIVVPNLINCSSRFRSSLIMDRYAKYGPGAEYYEQTALRHGQMQKSKIPKAEVASLANADTARVASLSPNWSVLSIYGTKDHIVPIEDCAFYANVLNRGPYTHHLELISGADHNFYGIDIIGNSGNDTEVNPHNLPLSKNNVVNYNYVVCAIIVKYLRTDQELARFHASNSLIGCSTRMKNVDGICNFRDLGGWPVRTPTFKKDEANSGTSYFVRSNLMFRCANPAQVTGSGLKDLQDLGIEAFFDLRSEEECMKDGIPQQLDSVGIERVHAPVFRHEDYSPEAIALRLSSLITSWHTYVHIYEQILESGVTSFRLMFEHLRDNPQTPMVFHCTAGKDRTGVFGMLVLKLAGVDRFTIAKEYELTTYGLIPDHEVIRTKFLAGVQKLQSQDKGGALAQMIIRGRTGWSVEEDGFNNLISSRAEAMFATMDLLDSKYGGILNYMTQCLKFSTEDIETIFDSIVCTSSAHPDGQVTWGSGISNFGNGMTKF
ncbi:hypothetical protein JCM33374_g3385 [Metschnikowia sp. JCM 33374]|nr:hypothetical protein JCM33374_g3385 [Metschnikowia sp. JCM 33374]